MLTWNHISRVGGKCANACAGFILRYTTTGSMRETRSPPSGTPELRYMSFWRTDKPD